MPDIEEELMTAAEGAEHLRIAERTLRQLAYDGKVVSVKIGKRLLFRKADLNDFIRSQRVGQ